MLQKINREQIKTKLIVRLFFLHCFREPGWRTEQLKEETLWVASSNVQVNVCVRLWAEKRNKYFFCCFKAAFFPFAVLCRIFFLFFFFFLFFIFFLLFTFFYFTKFYSLRCSVSREIPWRQDIGNSRTVPGRSFSLWIK